MKGKLTVGAPYIAKTENKVRLCSDLNNNGTNFTLYYEFDEAYESYLCTDRSDAFFVGLVRYAMYYDLDMEFSIPVSDTLYHNMTQYYMPIISQNIADYKNINVLTSTIPALCAKNEAAVGAAFSAGVDSFYTIVKNKKEAISKFRLTDLVIVNVGALTHNPKLAHSIFEKKLEKFTQCAEELGLSLIGIDTNFCEFIENEGSNRLVIQPEATKTLSCIFAMQSYFRAFFFSSGDALHMFELNRIEAGRYDLFTMKELSTESIQFYSTGSEMQTRIGKIKYIADEPVVQKYLCVCADFNCGRCNKCIRTEASLYAIGKLGLFSQVFDVDDYQKHMSTRFADMMTHEIEKVNGYTKEIIQESKQNNKRIPFVAYIKAYLFYYPARRIHAALKSFKWYKTLYYKKYHAKLHGEMAYLWKPNDMD